MSTMSGGPNIITNGLLTYLDSSNIKSNGNSTTLYNLINRSNTATVVNGTASSNFITLDGTNDYIQVNDTISSALYSPSVATFSLWFKPSSAVLNGRANSLISRGNYNTAGGFFIHLLTNTVSSNVPQVYATFSHSTTTSYSHNGTNSYTLRGFNVWSNVVVTCDSGISLWIDGVFKETNSSRTGGISNIVYGNGTINTGGDTNLILCSTLSYVPAYSDGYWEPYKGDFGLFQMWNRRLSNDEVLQNYNAHKSRFGLT